jgi:nitroreductase
MDFLDVVGSRRTIRWYKTWQPVATEEIQQILEVARLCTSPGNLQPWRAVVVWQDQLADDVREELLKAGNRQGGQVPAPVWIYWIADATAISPQAFRTQVNQLLEVEAGPREYNFTEDIVERAIEGGEEAPEGMAPIHEFKNLPPEIAGAIAAQETNGACVTAVLAATDQGLGPTQIPAGRPTSAGSRSSTPTPCASIRSGTAWPTSPSPSCGPKPAATPATKSFKTSSANSAPAATSSGHGGAPTTSATTAPATKRFHHRVVGNLTLAYESFEMGAEPGLILTIYSAEPGSPSEEGLRLLGSWAASEEAESADAPPS